MTPWMHRSSTLLSSSLSSATRSQKLSTRVKQAIARRVYRWAGVPEFQTQDVRAAVDLEILIARGKVWINADGRNVWRGYNIERISAGFEGNQVLQWSKATGGRYVTLEGVYVTRAGPVVDEL